MIAIELIGVMLLLSQNLFLVVFLRTNFRNFSKLKIKKFPEISILISARNEAHNLPVCLEALAKLDYPKDKLQILLANDNSDDETAHILQSWTSSYAFADYFEVRENLGKKKINGKANALAQMAEKATGEFLLFTDADCIVPPSWAKEMTAAALHSKVGFVTGVTSIKIEGLFSRMQDLDWIFTLGMVKIVSDLGVPVTSMGNNMLITREAYDAVGGFEGIDFSLTEDFEIARAIQKKNFTGNHQFGSRNLILTNAQPSWGSLWEQRKRWMYGAMKLPFFIKLLLALQALFLPLVLLLIFNYGWLGWIFWATKMTLQSYFIYYLKKKIDQKINPIYFLIFEIYYLFTAWTTILYYFWPSKTSWKGRKY
ncbi:glycosyl transferase [Belliella baltica DSM 15883]|uniref:Glycosyl transferase n=1 Tax=Belliella baltica (strain DSM 15883 / CIP 108006 / LMG 21964 / BA134) TaxID=866536 RepID=I3Z5G9_BELBD|nr:glycosyltransferase [Belliella baltica]AFL84487.1 glycosyl transferase [Belliella baltica DSM 15883]